MGKKKTITFSGLLLLSLFILSSCSTKTQEYSVTSVSEVKGGGESFMKKDSTTSNIPTDIKSDEKTEKEKFDKEQKELAIASGDTGSVVKSNVTSTGVDEKNTEVQSISLQSTEKIKKFEEEKFDYEKLKEGVSSDLVKLNISKTLGELKTTSLPKGTDIKGYDKLFFENINSGIYQDLKNIRVFIIPKSLFINGTVFSEITEEKGLDKDMKEVVIKKLSYFYIVDYNGSSYKVNKEKIDKYLNETIVKDFYINRTDTNFVYPSTGLGLSGYYLYTLLTALNGDGKTGVLQYFSSLQSLLPTSGITNDHPLIKHQKYLESYTSVITRKL